MKFVIFMLIWVLYGCRVSSEDVLQQMKENSCKGDVKQFFSKVNEDKLQISFFKQAIRDGVVEEDKLKLFELYRQYINIWKDDIRRGQQSDFCQANIVDKRIQKNKAEYLLQYSDGKRYKIILLRFANDWLLSYYYHHRSSGKR